MTNPFDYKNCSPYKWPEENEVRADTDKVTLRDSCGYYTVPVSAIGSSGGDLSNAVVKNPTSQQTIQGDNDLLFDGSNYGLLLGPNRIFLSNKSNGGLAIDVDDQGNATYRIRNNQVFQMQDNLLQMSVPIKMTVEYRAQEPNDVVPKLQLDIVDVRAQDALLLALSNKNRLDNIDTDSIARTDIFNSFEQPQQFQQGAQTNELTLLSNDGPSEDGELYIRQPGGAFNGETWFLKKIDGADQIVFRFLVNGDSVLSTGATSGLITSQTGGNLRGTWTGTVTSDERLKENITPRDGLSNILALNGVDWDWKPGQGMPSGTAGCTAQNWATVYPDQVEEVDGVLKITRPVNDMTIIADLVEAIKSQQSKINELEEIIKGLL